MKSFFSCVMIALFVFAGSSYAYSSRFTDQGEFASWYASEVDQLVNKGIINGYDDGSFRPNDAVSRAEVAVMLDRAMNFVLSPEDVFNVLDNYEKLLAEDFNPLYAKDLAIAASGYGLQDEVPTQISEDTCDFEVELDFTDSYKLYSCAYTIIIHVRNDNYSAPLGASSASIDKWYVSDTLNRGTFMPSLFE
jgi:hypothetical protein